MESSIPHIINLLCRLQELIHARLTAYFNKNETDALQILPINIDDEEIIFLNSSLHLSLLPDECIVLLLALTPHLQPNFLESIIQKYLPTGGDFPEIGGTKGGAYRGMLPTGETAQFILAGDDLQKRIEVQQLITDGNMLKENIVWIEPVKEGEPVMSGRLVVAQEWIDKILFGKEVSMKYSADFPAKRIVTNMTWDDLVLNSFTQSQLTDVMIWMQHNTAVMQDEIMKRKIKPGYRVLFYGPSGTGKTLTATLMGKQFGKEVYRIDISQMVSKYIGETQKNLEKIFSRAEHKNWILFFDEADALFGKRTNVQSSHDRYANQEVSYLLQRVEDYPGLLILASNFKSNIDDAFLRRFHSIIHFPNPKPADRLKLWQQTLPANYKPEPSVNLTELAEKYELNGAAIVNIVHHATLKAASRNDEFIRHGDITDAIRREYRKEERSMN